MKPKPWAEKAGSADPRNGTKSASELCAATAKAKSAAKGAWRLHRELSRANPCISELWHRLLNLRERHVRLVLWHLVLRRRLRILLRRRQWRGPMRPANVQIGCHGCACQHDQRNKGAKDFHALPFSVAWVDAENSATSSTPESPSHSLERWDDATRHRRQ